MDDLSQRGIETRLSRTKSVGRAMIDRADQFTFTISQKLENEFPEFTPERRGVDRTCDADAPRGDSGRSDSHSGERRFVHFQKNKSPCSKPSQTRR